MPPRVMVGAIDGSVIDPYNFGWASMTALLRRTLLPEAELNPHPVWEAPAAFFFLRTAYAIGLLVVSFGWLGSKSPGSRGPGHRVVCRGLVCALTERGLLSLYSPARHGYAAPAGNV